MDNETYFGGNSSIVGQQGYISKEIYRNRNTIRSQQENTNFIGNYKGYEQHQVYITDPSRVTQRNSTNSGYIPTAGNDNTQGYRIVNQSCDYA